MKNIAAVSILLLLIAGIAYAKDYEVTKKAGEFTVTASIDNNPPVAGDNNISVVIKDSTGKTVTDARVKVEYSMPAMPGMPAMNYKTDALPKGTAYNAKLNLSMAGSWNVAVKVSKGGKSSTMKFNIDAH